MNTGLGFSEIMLILVLVLMFFGSKEIPQFIRTVAKFMAKIRMYTEKVRREIDSVTQVAEIAPVNTAAERKKEFRKQFIACRKALTDTERSEKSDAVFRSLAGSQYLNNASTVMLYANIGSEVETVVMIRQLLSQGKRIILPYCSGDSADMGIAEIHDYDKEICISADGIPEVNPEFRKPFLKSDLQLVICPGVAFDISGARLGRGKSVYDRFLKELKGRIPLLGLAFDCQISKENLPFEYHDISMDQVITESGFLLKVDNEQKSEITHTAAESVK